MIPKKIKRNYPICVIKKLYYLFLQQKYGFNKWHATAPYECRVYKKYVVEIANNLKVNSVCEIGGGLGEILKRINCKNKYLIDSDDKIIEYHSKTSPTITPIYGNFDLPETISANTITNIDLITTVNWPHNIKPKTYYNSIKHLSQKWNTKYLILDLILEKQNGFQYHHKKEFITEIASIHSIYENVDGVRSLILYKFNF
jgi:hypothetical protein